MAISVGTHLGSHEITALLGKGGMGEVYRARDTKLKRDVAIKILPDEFARDADRVSRFQREAELLASLNHPNIAAIYDLEEANGFRYLILELVDGETLAERLKRGPIAASEALRIAQQIADALEAAHERGVIHRDLKPANVKITPEGKLKVLDFGLAKAMEAGSANAGLSNSPTLSNLATNAGIILGTAAYMSPEQANGFAADRRSDIFSFGVVLYEMFTGRQPFQGRTTSEVMASVLVREPDWTTMPANLNQRILELIRRCLQKDAKARWQAVGDVRVEIESLLSNPLEVVPAHRTAPPRPLWKRGIPVVLTALVVAAIASVAAWNLKPSPPAGVVARFPMILPQDQLFTTVSRSVVAISPDSTKLVYVANNQLYLRQLSEMEARPIAGAAAGVSSPFFSPDGQWVGFWSNDGTLKKIAITGGAPITICKSGNPYGVSWDGNDIVFSDLSAAKGVLRVSANGGEPEVLVKTNLPEVPTEPQLLDHGKAVLFTSGNGVGSIDRWDQAQIVVQSLSTGETKTIIRGGSRGRYVPSGHIIYAVGGNILAVPFDLKRLEAKGGPVPIIEGVMRSAGGITGTANFAFSDNGTLVYVPGAAGNATTRTTLALADISGKVQPLPLPLGTYSHPRISPDGKQLVVQTDDGKDQIVWIYEMSGGTTLRRLTFGGKNQYPIWSNDGRRVIFTSDREGDKGLFWQPADGTGTAERLTKADQSIEHRAQAIDPAGKALAFFALRGTAGGIFVLPMNGDRTPTVFAELPNSFQPHAAFSPTGRWVVYSSTEVPVVQVFVQPYPSTGSNYAKYQITTDPGAANAFPVWSPDGKQIFYASPPKMFTVDVRTEPTFSFGKPTALPVTGFVQPTPGMRNFDITRDGKHFVVVMPASGPSQNATNPRIAAQINVVMNWFEELKQRVPAR
jgi:eukaryotic-like serine/threonine-protein kinase